MIFFKYFRRILNSSKVKVEHLILFQTSSANLVLDFTPLSWLPIKLMFSVNRHNPTVLGSIGVQTGLSFCDLTLNHSLRLLFFFPELEHMNFLKIILLKLEPKLLSIWRVIAQIFLKKIQLKVCFRFCLHQRLALNGFVFFKISSRDTATSSVVPFQSMEPLSIPFR